MFRIFFYVFPNNSSNKLSKYPESPYLVCVLFLEKLSPFPGEVIYYPRKCYRPTRVGRLTHLGG